MSMLDDVLMNDKLRAENKRLREALEKLDIVCEVCRKHTTRNKKIISKALMGYK